MKVLQTIAGIDPKAGGPTTCTLNLLSAINKMESIDLLSVQERRGDKDFINKSWLKLVENDYKTPIYISKNLKDFLIKSDYDLYHTNGLWMYVNHLTAKIARKKGRPYIITPHGTLYAYALAIKSWKKKPMLALWFNKDINNASCIHVNCLKEMEEVRKFGYKGPIAVIPNLIEVPDYTLELIENRTYKKGGNIKIGFLGRLHPIKNIDKIIQGISLAKNKNVEFYIIGSGEESYEEQLKSLVSQLELKDRVYFLGFLQDKDKFEQISKLDAILLPSEMENFSMVVLESLLVGTPVMASLGTPWKSLNENRCGWWRENSPESIANIIDKIGNLSGEELKVMGLRGRNFIIEHFASDIVARKMIYLYKWILGEIPKPEFVYMD